MNSKFKLMMNRMPIIVFWIDNEFITDCHFVSIIFIMITNIELTELSSGTTLMSDFHVKSVEMADPTKRDEGYATSFYSG